MNVVRNRPPERDRYGDPDGSTSTVTIMGCKVAPTGVTETHDRSRESVVTGLSLMAPYDADILHGDTITISSGPYAATWTVEGDPRAWMSPLTGRKFGLVAELRRARG